MFNLLGHKSSSGFLAGWGPLAIRLVCVIWGPTSGGGLGLYQDIWAILEFEVSTIQHINIISLAMLPHILPTNLFISKVRRSTCIATNQYSKNGCFSHVNCALLPPWPLAHRNIWQGHIRKSDLLKSTRSSHRRCDHFPSRKVRNIIQKGKNTISRERNTLPSLQDAPRWSP